MLDVYSRYVVGWLLADRESAELTGDMQKPYLQDGLAIVMMANGSAFDRNELVDAAANMVFSMTGGRLSRDNLQAIEKEKDRRWRVESC